MTKQRASLSRFRVLSGVAAALTVVACYGTLAVVSALSMLGMSLTVNEGLWAGAIALFAVLTVLFIAMSYRRHGFLGPLVVASFSALLILWVMFGSFSRVLEITGLTGLVAASIWNWRLKSREIPTA